MEKPIKTRQKGDDTAAIVAEVYGVTDRYVRMVIAGDRENPAILAAYIQMKEGKNLLIQAIKKAIPF